MPRGGLDKFHQVPGAPQKMSRLPSPPTTGNRKTGTLRQDGLSIASAEAGTFPQQNSDLAQLLHFPARIAACDRPNSISLLEALGGPLASVAAKPLMAPYCPQDKIGAPRFQQWLHFLGSPQDLPLEGHPPFS